MSRTYDIVIVGGGVVGCMIARSLSRFELDVALLERGADVCSGSSKANTAIVHAGYDAEPGSLKAKFNVIGNRMYDQVCAELKVPFARQGTYVVAVSDDELPVLDELYQRGIHNGVTDMEMISGDNMRRIEPVVSTEARRALFSATGGLVDPFLLTIAAAENAVTNGVELLLETEVSALLQQDGQITGVRTNGGDVRARYVVNAAGIYADQLMASVGIEEFRIHPRKGEYYVFDRDKSPVRAVLFPTPTPISKGILVTPTIHGNTLIGPNAIDICDKEDKSVTSAGLAEVMAGACRLVPCLNMRDVIAVFAGLRATGNTGDFWIKPAETVRGLINVAGIESPGLTASPAIAEYVVELLGDIGLELREKMMYNPLRHAPPCFRDLSLAERRALIERDPRYGRIVCRCETVTEGELVAAIHSPVPARTYDALKRRTRLGTGRCQGGFDTPRAMEILARELGVSPLAVTKEGPGSEFAVRETKEA